jgi:hypothetical protein
MPATPLFYGAGLRNVRVGKGVLRRAHHATAVGTPSGAHSRDPVALPTHIIRWRQLRTVMQEMSECFRVRQTASA